MKKLLSLIIVLTLFSTQTSFAKTFGVITAVPDEAKYLLNHMKHVKSFKKGLFHYHQGKLGHNKVIVVSGGVGLVNTAVATTQMIMYFHPSQMLFSGTAGGTWNSEHVGDVYVVSKALLMDLGNPDGMKPEPLEFSYYPIHKEPVFFPANKQMITKAEKTTVQLKAITAHGKIVPGRVLTAAIATTGHFPNDGWDVKRLKAFHIPVVAMETASFMKVCWMFHQPCLAFRAVSDILEPAIENANTAWNHKNAMLAANNAGRMVVAFIKGS